MLYTDIDISQHDTHIICLMFISLTMSHSFYLHAHKKVEIMTETYSKMEDAYREVCLMFSESPKTVEPSDFFGMFQKFVKAWKAS